MTDSRKPPSQRSREYTSLRHGNALQSMVPGTHGGRVLNAGQIKTLQQAAGESSSSLKVFEWSTWGILQVRSGTHRMYAEDFMTVSFVRASVAQSSAGTDIIVDVRVNVTSSILNSQLVIAAGTNTVTQDISYGLSPGDFVTVDVVQIGATVEGRDLTVVLYGDGGDPT